MPGGVPKESDESFVGASAKEKKIMKSYWLATNTIGVVKVSASIHHTQFPFSHCVYSDDVVHSIYVPRFPLQVPYTPINDIQLPFDLQTHRYIQAVYIQTATATFSCQRTSSAGYI